MKKSEILKLMNDIVEHMPLGLNDSEDGRYIWPARWDELARQIEEYPYGTTKKGIDY